MRILVDENVPEAVTLQLRHDGHAIRSVREFAAGCRDEEVLDHLTDEELLVTEDKDFGELVLRRGSPQPGILLVRLSGIHPSRRAVMVSAAIAQHGSRLLGSFTVISPSGVRLQPREPL